MIFITLFSMLVLNINCDFKKSNEIFSFVITNAKLEKKISIKLKNKFNFQQMVIKENTLNDTFYIGLMKIPPGKTGLLYHMEFFSDSIAYFYKPYKANSGKLVIEHSFTDGY